MKGYQALSPKSKQAINELADNILKDLAQKKRANALFSPDTVSTA